MFEIGSTDSIMVAPSFQLNTKRSGLNPFASVDEMSNIEQPKGVENPFKKPDELKEAFELDDPKNRFKILNLFPREQQEELVSLLSDEALCLGMKLYEKEKIMNFLFDTEQKDIAKVLKKVMPEKQIFELIPEKFLNKFLLNEELKKENFTKALEKFDSQELKKLMESMIGMPQNGKTPKEMINMLEGIPMDKLQPMFLTIEPEHKASLIANMMKNDEELFELFPKSHLLLPLEQNEKDVTIKGLSALEPEMIGGMLQELPEELLPVLLTLIEPDALAEALIEKYPEIIMQALAGNANQ